VFARSSVIRPCTKEYANQVTEFKEYSQVNCPKVNKNKCKKFRLTKFGMIGF
jgi:hypothetical protein